MPPRPSRYSLPSRVPDAAAFAAHQRQRQPRIGLHHMRLGAGGRQRFRRVHGGSGRKAALQNKTAGRRLLAAPGACEKILRREFQARCVPAARRAAGRDGSGRGQLGRRQALSVEPGSARWLPPVCPGLRRSETAQRHQAVCIVPVGTAAECESRMSVSAAAATEAGVAPDTARFGIDLTHEQSIPMNRHARLRRADRLRTPRNAREARRRLRIDGAVVSPVANPERTPETPQRDCRSVRQALSGNQEAVRRWPSRPPTAP